MNGAPGKKIITTADNHGQLTEIFLQIMKPLSDDFLLRFDFGFASIVERCYQMTFLDDVVLEYIISLTTQLKQSSLLATLPTSQT